jgi:lipopolysaccharide/colanic/teichoic acid biosynthesis glycosyltransferase
MHEHNAEDDVRTATKEDNRVFPFGEYMRKTRIDEIPQFINILKGEVSLIGPRAEWDKLTIEYEKQIPYYNQRHVVKPGITGWAQVMFVEGRSKEDTKQKLMYDLYYIKHWSLMLEFKVILKTILVVVGKRGI